MIKKPISADSHITEPPHCYVDYIDPKFRDRAPRIQRIDKVGDAFIVDGMGSPVPMGLVAAASGVVIYCLARRVFGARQAYLPWALWCCGALTNFPILSYHWIGTLWALLAMHWILRWREGEPGALLPLAAFWSLALWCFQADGLAVGQIGRASCRERV